MKHVFAPGECEELAALEAELLLQGEFELADLPGIDLDLMLMAPEIEPGFKDDLYLTAPEEEFMLESGLQLDEPEKEFLLEEELTLPVMETEIGTDMETLVSLLKKYPGMKVTLSY
jgi:hypothetical protein